jgi:hypothetical protein
MKVRFLLGLSLALNVYLIFVAIRHKDKGSKPETLNIGAAVAEEIKPTASTNSAAKRFDWQSVEAEDYTTYIANLRAIQTRTDEGLPSPSRAGDELDRARHAWSRPSR